MSGFAEVRDRRFKMSKRHLVEELEALEGELAGLNRTEDALRFSEEGFRVLVENSIQGIIVESKGRIIFANQTFAEMLGYRDTDAVRRAGSILAFVDLVDRNRLARFLDAGQDEDAASSFDAYRGIRKDGTSIWLAIRLKAVSWEGEPALLSTIADVTDEHAAHQRIADLAKFPSENPHPVLRIFPTGRVLYANVSVRRPGDFTD